MPLVYSDNPESFSLVPTEINYLWGGNIGTQAKDLEMYHHLWNGWSNNAKIGAGVAIYNNNSAAVKYAAGAKSTTSGDTDALTVTPNVLANFMKASTTSITVPAKTIKFMPGLSTNFETGYAKFISYHGQIKSSVNTGVSYRMYVAGEQKLAAGTELFAPTKQPLPAASSAFFCGELPYNKVSATISAETAISNKWAYKIFRHPRAENGEYAAVADAMRKPGSNPYHPGNFGVQYTLTIKANSGRYIWIEPDWTIPDRPKATIVYRFNNGTWTSRPTPITNNGCWYLSLPIVSGQAIVDFFLPGGNAGNFWVYFT